MPKWKELKRYLDKTGWELYRTTDHYYYRKGRLRIKCSMGSGEIHYQQWRYILTHELHITQEEFNAGL